MTNYDPPIAVAARFSQETTDGTRQWRKDGGELHSETETESAVLRRNEDLGLVLAITAPGSFEPTEIYERLNRPGALEALWAAAEASATAGD